MTPLPQKDYCTSTEMLTCKQCLRQKPLSGFYLISGKQDRYRQPCIECWAARHTPYRLASEEEKQRRRDAARRYRQRHPEKARASVREWAHRNRALLTEKDRLRREKNPYRYAGYQRARRLRTYCITADEYEALLQQHNNACAICGATDRKLTLDHDHRCCPAKATSCGKCIRGLLCHQCNRAIGLLGDDPEILQRATAYVARISSAAPGGFGDECEMPVEANA